MTIRPLIWNVFESKTTLDEVRESVPVLDAPSRWIWNEATDRFGVIAFGDELPEALGYVQDLIGDEPNVYEEFDSAN